MPLRTGCRLFRNEPPVVVLTAHACAAARQRQKREAERENSQFHLKQAGTHDVEELFIPSAFMSFILLET
jgi:hypothetical protein